jgi:predicted PurR-regulated permease PerM
MASASDDARAAKSLKAVAAAVSAMAVWAATFLILWMCCRYLAEDLMVSVVLSGVALVTLSPVLGVLTRPASSDGRRHNG